MGNRVHTVGAGEHWLDVVQSQVSALRFGVVQLTVHESKVVQLDITVKIRLPQNPEENNPSSSLQGKTNKQNRPTQTEAS